MPSDPDDEIIDDAASMAQQEAINKRTDELMAQGMTFDAAWKVVAAEFGLAE